MNTEFNYLTAYINDTPLSTYSAVLQNFSVGAAEVSTSYWQGANRTNFTLLKQQVGLRSITLSVAVYGENYREAVLSLSTLTSTLLGKVTLNLPDGFLYTCTMDSGSEEPQRIGSGTGQIILLASFSLIGYRHDPMITVLGPSVWCPSTTPRTDCILSVTVGTSAGTYTLGGAIFFNVKRGEKLVFDGINKRIMRNGAPGAATVTWIDFPYLTPGKNIVQAADPVTCQFYPCFM